MPIAILDSLEARRLFAAASTGTAVAGSPASGGTTTDSVYAIPRAAVTRLVGGTLYVEGTKRADVIYASVIDGKVGIIAVDSYVTFADRSIPRIVVRNTDGYVILTATGIFGIGGNDYDTSYAVVPDGDGYAVRVDAPPKLKRYDLGQISRVVVNTGDDADSVDLSALAVPAEVHAGKGRDTLTGGAGDDTLYGDGGDDVINGGRGSNVLVGGSGGDLLNSRKGPDILLGGAGDDRLYAYAREAALNGGAGTDTGLLQAAPDGVTGVEVTSTRSRYDVTPVDASAYGVTATLRKSGRGLAVDTGVVLSDSGWAVDWDLVRNGSGSVTVDATAYRTTGGAAQALTPYVNTFELGQTLARRAVKVTVTQAGRDLLRGTVLVGPGFASKTLKDGEFARDVVLDAD